MVKIFYASFQHVAKAKFTRTETIDESESSSSSDETMEGSGKSEDDIQSVDVDEDSLMAVTENEETKPGKGFKFQCKRGFAMSKCNMKTKKVKSNAENDDTVYKMSCQKIVKEEQVRKIH